MIYEIADLRVFLDNRYPFTTKFCKAYEAEDQSVPAQITASVLPEELEEERTLSPGFSDGYIENICLYRSLCLQIPAFDRMLMHAAILEYDGSGYAFLGKSGTGKSTHTGLWLQYLGGRIVNGDKPILSFSDREVYAYGTPWMGKEGRGCKAKTPLKALCFLEQAKENKIRRLSASETTSRLFNQLLIPTEEQAAIKTLELADALIQRIPAYLLSCDISEEAVKTSYEALTGKEYKPKGENL
ncbi:MAG: hypothetical protein IJX98_01145 [Clostridia bacterium]|nr:hypothetical protein [Clostridia bacterium]